MTVDKNLLNVVDFGCGSGKHTSKFKLLGAKRIIVVDNSLHQLEKTVENTYDCENLAYTRTMKMFKDEIDVVFSKHVFVTMTLEERKSALIELFDSMSFGSILTIAEINLEHHVQGYPDEHGMSMQTKNEAYPSLKKENIVDGMEVKTVLKLLLICESVKNE